MNVFGWIFSGVFLLFAALALLIGALKGKKYTWLFSLSRLVVVVVSVIASVLIAKLLSSLVSGILLGLFGNLGSFGELMNTLPSADETVTVLVTMFLAPIVFYPVFLIVRGLLTLLVRPLTDLFLLIGRAIKKQPKPTAEEETKEPREKLSRKERKKLKYGVTGPNPIGMICGAVCSFMVLCVFLIPVTGALGMADDMADVSAEERAEASEPEQQDPILSVVMDIADGLSDNVGTKTVNALGGSAVYDWMTSGRVNGERAYLTKEADFLSAVIQTAVVMVDEEEAPADVAETVRGIAPAFEKAHIIPTLMAEFLAGASDSWSRGEDFCGIAAPEMGEEMAPVAEELWVSLKDSDEASVKEDVKTIVYIMAALVEHEGMDAMKEDPIRMMSDRELVADIMYEFLENERLEHMVDVVLDFGMESALKQLEVRANLNGAYDELTAAFAAVENEAREAGLIVPLMAIRYRQLLNQYGIPHETTPAEFEVAAAQIMEGTLRTSELLARYVTSQQDLEEKSVLVCIEDVLIEGGESGDNQTEAQLIADAFEKLLKVLEDLDQSNPDMGTLLTDFGPALDSLAATKTVGQTKTERFLMAFLQAKSVRENCNFTLLEATAVGNSIIAGSHSEGGFTDMMKTLGKTVTVIESAADLSGLTAEEVVELLEVMSPEAAEVIDSLSTPEVIEKYGATTESAGAVSEMISNIFNDYSTLQASGTLTEEQKAKEAAAMTDMINVMLSTGEKNAETLFGEEGVLGTDADAYVDTLFQSQVLSEAVLNVAYDESGNVVQDPLKIEKSLDTAEQEQLVEAFNAQYESTEAADQADAEKLIYATAAMMNVNVSLTDGQWILG